MLSAGDALTLRKCQLFGTGLCSKYSQNTWYLIGGVDAPKNMVIESTSCIY